LANDSTPQYIFPIRFPGMVTLKLIFFDSTSNQSSQRAFQVYANEIRLEQIPLDIFNLTGGPRRLLIREYQIPFGDTNSSKQSELKIRLLEFQD
jgi:hypothetical protein